MGGTAHMRQYPQQVNQGVILDLLSLRYELAQVRAHSESPIHTLAGLVDEGSFDGETDNVKRQWGRLTGGMAYAI